MFRNLLPAGLSIASLVVMGLPAAARDQDFRLQRPYVIAKSCDDDLRNCHVRMVYAPGQNPGLAGYGSYWYQRATRAVRVVNPTHVAWCLAHYRTYDPYSNTFVGKGHRAYLCNSPYDGI